MTLAPLTAEQTRPSQTGPACDWKFRLASDCVPASAIARTISRVAAACDRGSPLANFILGAEAEDDTSHLTVRFSVPVAVPETLLAGRKYWVSGLCARHSETSCACNPLGRYRFDRPFGVNSILLSSVVQESQIVLRRTENGRVGARDFVTNRLHLTAPTGNTAMVIDQLHPELQHARHSRLTDLVWALNFPEELSDRMVILASRLHAASGRLERAACGTLKMLDWSFAAPLSSTTSVRASHRTGSISIRYPPFWPNREIAEEVGMILAECEGEEVPIRAIDYDSYLHQGTERDELLLTILVPPWPGWQAAIADLAPRPEINDMLQRMAGDHPPCHEEVLGSSLSTGRILLGRFQATWYQSCPTQLYVDDLGLARVGDVPSPLLNLSGTEDLAALLFAGAGVSGYYVLDGRGRLPFGPSPSPGALNTYDAYVINSRVEGLEQASYRYLPDGHALERVKLGCWSYAELFGEQTWCENACAAIILVAKCSRQTWKYRHPHALGAVLVEAGHRAQNILLVAEQLGLAAVPLGLRGVGAYSRRITEEALGMTGSWDVFPVHGVVLGIIDPAGDPLAYEGTMTIVPVQDQNRGNTR